MPTSRKKTAPPPRTPATLRTTRSTSGKKVVVVDVDDQEDDSAAVIASPSSSVSSPSVDNNLSSRHPARSATTTTTNSDTNPTEDSNSRINRAATTSTAATNVNNNGRVNTNSAAVNVGGITTRRSRSISQAQQNKNSTTSSSPSSSSSGPQTAAVIASDQIIDVGEELNLNLFTRKKATNIITNNRSKDDEEEDLLSKSSTSEEEESDPANLVVISNVLPPPPVRSSEDEEDGNSSHSPERAESVDSEGDVAYQASYSIIVNPDGSLHLVDDDTQINLVPGQEQFSVTLPKNKVKSPNNPLPGAVLLPAQQGRARKSKPEGSTYGTTSGGRATAAGGTEKKGNVVDHSASGSKVIKEATMSVGINQQQQQPHPSVITSTTPVSLDIDEFTNSLDPQSLATLENLIQSQQAELIENLNLEHHDAHMSVSVSSEGGQNKWTDGRNQQNSMGSLGSESSIGGMTSPGSSAESSPSAFREGNRHSTGGGRPSSTSRNRGSSMTSGSRLSESDSNIRRSQRQQDRIERQEAERIMAENQQMLQREKELMQGAKASGSSSPFPPVASKKIESPSQTTGILTPQTTPPPPTKPALVGRASASSSIASSRDSIDSSGSDRKPYPKRENRRLPAHLADPNYVSLEEDGGPRVSADDIFQEKLGGTDEAKEKESPMEVDDDDYVQEETEDGEEDYTEDDPNKLWCICRQPHNNRFMICCDTCEEWFHGKCVGVTKAQGKAMELKNILWVCPPCRKAELELKRNAKAAERASNSARRSVSTSGDKNDTRRMSKGAAALQADAAAAAVASKTAFMPNLSKKGSLTTSTKKRSESRSDESRQGSCVVCSKPPRKDSIYCSDQCVQKHADNVGNKSATQEKGKISLAESPTSSSPNKLKRMNSKPDVKSSEPIFNFHVISAGATKSTEVAPPKPKEMTASQILKAQKEAQSPTKVSPALPSVVGVSPNSVSSIISSTPSVLVKKMSEGKINVKLAGKSSPDEEEKPSKSRTASQSDTKNKSSTRKSDSSKNKEKEKDTASSNKLHRDILRKSLREILKRRMEELSDNDKKKFNDGPNNPDALAEKITDELCKTYGGANTPKCKNKYRGIYFNLKAEKNDMYKELLNGKLKPKNLVRMESHDMASADLIEWRKKEAEKEIEAIKKAELDKITESKKMALLEKGVDDAAKVAEELRPLDISDVIDQSSSSAAKETDKEHSLKDKSRHHSTSEKSKDHSSSSSRRDRDKGESSSKSSSNKDKRDKDRRRSDRHKDSSSSHRDKDRKSSSSSHRDIKTDKEKVKLSDSKHKENDKRVVKDSESNCQVSSGSGTDEQSKSPQLVTELAPKITPPSNEEVSSSPSSVDDKVNLTPKPLEQQDTEQEQPSSTIKTPDFVEDGVKKDSEPKHLFQTKIVMPELGSFHASAHGVSHAIIDGVFFPKSPVPVVGRISPDTVWDYINKMKKSKEVIVFRLSPASPADSSDYMTFFSYFSSRSRLGVIGGIESPLKDVYLVPLPKQAPIPRCLLPFRGPGLPNERTHCLLCIVTRNIRDPSATATGLKRKPSLLIDQALTQKKRAKLDPESEEKSAATSSPSTGLRSRTINLPKPPVPAAADPKINDDDAPYTPWEDESTSSNSDSQPPLLTPETLLPGATLPPKQSVDVKRQLEELEAKIAREKQDIEKITGALAGRSSMSGIPGLDGEFGEDDDEGEAAAEKMETEDSSPPEIIAITPPPPAIAPAVVQEPTHMSDPRLRRSQRYGNNSGVTAQSSVPAAVESLPVVEKKDSTPVEIMDLGSSDDSSSKDEPDGKEKKESEEEAYSPSAIQFSDEETNDSQDAKNKTVVLASPLAPLPPVVVPPETPEVIVAPEEKGEVSSQVDKFPDPPPIPKEVEVMDVEDDEPLPPGEDVFVERPQPPPPSVSLISTFKPVITHIDDIKITMPKTPTKTSAISSSAQQQQQSQTVQQSTVDLDDFQQPMRSLAVKQTESKVESSIFEKKLGSSSGAGVVTSPLKSLTIGGGPSGSTGGSKMKININLITKQLPVAVDTPKTEEVVAVVSPPAPTPAATPILHPPPPTSLFSQPALKPIIIPAPSSPLKIHELTVPHIQQQPPNPIMLPATTMPPPVPSIPTHIPPPNLLPPPLNGGSSMVINLNVPPPSFMMSRPPPSTVPSPVGFPPPPLLHHQGYPSRVPFTSQVPPQTVPPPSLPPSSMPPASSRMGNPPAPGFMPTFGSTSPPHGQFPGPRTPVMTSGERERDRETISRNLGDTSEDAARVQRINLDRSGGGDRERDRPFRGRGREMRGGGGRHRDSRPDRDNFPRRHTGGGRINRSPIQRIRRRRSGSRDRSRSRSRSPGRDRRHRKRTSRSRSKSPLSRRWEARNRSRSRSAGRRVVGRNKSRTPSPRRRRSSRSRSPKRIARRGPSPKSRSASPPSPLLRPPTVAPKNLPAADSDEDWEGDSAKNTDDPLQPIVPSDEARPIVPNAMEN